MHGSYEEYGGRGDHLKKSRLGSPSALKPYRAFQLCVIVALMTLFVPALAWGQSSAPAQPSTNSGPATSTSPSPSQGSGLENLESMRLSDIGRTLHDWKLPLLIAASVLVFILLWSGDVIRPGSMGRSGRRVVKPLPIPIWLMTGFLIYAAPGMVLQSISKVSWIVGQNPDALQATAAPMVLSYLIAALLAIGLLIMTHKAAPQAGLKLDWIDPPIGIGLLILAMPFVLLAGDIAQIVNHSLTQQAASAQPDAIAHPLLQLIVDNRHDPWSWAIIAAVVLAAPIVEEAVFRVYLQSALLGLLRNTWAAIIVTAAIFGTVHAIGSPQTASPWYAAVEVGMLGLCMGAAYERTKRIGVPIAMHAAFNALNVGLALWGTSGT